MRILPFMVLAALLAGCSLFSDTAAWTKPGVTPEQAEADLGRCREVATARQQADQRIEQDKAGSAANRTTGAIDTELSQNLSRQRASQRFNSIVDSCMRQLGYSPAEQASENS